MVEATIKRYENIWDKMLRDSDGNPVGCEYGFKINIPGTDVPMNGYMDLVIEESPDTIHVIDYKTGTWTQNYEECCEDIQVRMYSLAARREFVDDISKKGYKYKNVILTFDYFTDKPIMVAFTAEQDLNTEREVLSKIKEIESTEWINRIVPSNSALEERNARGGYKYFKCQYLCDAKVCASTWNGGFKTDGKD
jgi:hypothetical protein